MKILLRYVTAIGSRTIVAEVGDIVTAQAVVNAHLAHGEEGALVEEMPRLSMKSHMAKSKRAKPKIKLEVITAPANVTPIRKARAK